MKALAYLVFSPVGILVGCAVAIAMLNRKDEPPVVDPEIRHIVANWRVAMDQAEIEYTAGLNRLDSIYVVDDELAGHYSPSRSSVFISRNSLDLSDAQLRATVWHELGHAVFKLGHQEDGIMSSTVRPSAITEADWPEDSVAYLDLCKSNEYNASH